MTERRGRRSLRGGAERRTVEDAGPYIREGGCLWTVEDAGPYIREGGYLWTVEDAGPYRGCAERRNAGGGVPYMGAILNSRAVVLGG